MGPIPPTFAWGFAAVVAAAALSCGPGLEMVHESNLRFEHCYRLDIDEAVARVHREKCWRDWLLVYADEQPLDRIEHARLRLLSLEAGDDRRVSLGDPRRAPRVFTEVGGAPHAGPAPTSAHSPPPRVEPAPSATPAAPSAAVPRPGEACAAACALDHDQCRARCGDAGQACERCAGEFRRCMRRCYD